MDFFAFATDKRVMAVVEIFFHFAADETFDSMYFVNEMELLHHLNNAINGNGVEVDFVLLERNFGDLVW